MIDSERGGGAGGGRFLGGKIGRVGEVWVAGIRHLEYRMVQ